MRYCPTDQQMVETEKEFSWPWAIAWLILGAGWGIFVYLIYYAFKSETKCVRCGSDTLSSPPPGFVENPNTNAQYVPKHVAEQHKEIHGAANSRLSAGTQNPSVETPDERQAIPSAAEDWEDVSPMAHTTCPNCHQQFSVEKRRPLRVTCPACGTSGRLPSKDQEQPEVFTQDTDAVTAGKPAAGNLGLDNLAGLGGAENWERGELENVGIGTIGELAASSPQRIAKDTDISKDRAQDLIRRAQARQADTN